MKSSKVFLWWSPVLFASIYATVFYIFGDNFLQIFQQISQALPIYEFTSNSALQTQEMSSKYGIFGGIVFAVLSYIILIVLLLLSKILFLGKFRWRVVLIILLNYIIIGSLGVWLVYFEPAIMPISVGVIEFIGKPLLYSTIAMLILVILHVFYSLICKKIGK